MTGMGKGTQPVVNFVCGLWVFLIHYPDESHIIDHSGSPSHPQQLTLQFLALLESLFIVACLLGLKPFILKLLNALFLY